MADVVKQVAQAVGLPASVRIGQITSINPTVVSAQGAVFTNVGFLGSFRPKVGDPVALLGQSSQLGSDPTSWLALGDLVGVPAGHQASKVLVSFVGQTGFTQVVVFPEPFNDAPNVHVNIDVAPASTAQWHSRAIDITASQFTLFVFTAGAANTWASVPVGWSAFARTA